MIAGALTDLKILVVENDLGMRKFLRAVLSASAGGIAEYAEVTNGEEALRVLDVYTPDIVVSNWGSGPVSGIDLLRRIREGAAGDSAFLPFIMLTTRDDAHWRAEARDAGVSKYLLKPAPMQKLLQAIADVTQDLKPFVRSEGYFGPDRRNRDTTLSGPERRFRAPEYIFQTNGDPLIRPAFTPPASSSTSR